METFKIYWPSFSRAEIEFTVHGDADNWTILAVDELDDRIKQWVNTTEKFRQMTIWNEFINQEIIREIEGRRENEIYEMTKDQKMFEKFNA